MIIKYAPLIKHPSFKEEREWRIVTTSGHDYNYHKVDFREGKSFIVPYKKIPLVDEESSVDIKEVIIGPTPHTELAEKSCKMYLGSNWSKAKVTPCGIPYRNW